MLSKRVIAAARSLLFSRVEMSNTATLLYRCRKDGAHSLRAFFSAGSIANGRSLSRLSRKVANSQMRHAQFHSSHLLQGQFHDVSKQRNMIVQLLLLIHS
ncbi:hypothetical protein BDR07DRAFT_1038200 [Suillus spraguei]|nr:hypothetical protein BDR07DRAFT_1038200 [Suillus spraguei]